MIVESDIRRRIDQMDDTKLGKIVFTIAVLGIVLGPSTGIGTSVGTAVYNTITCFCGDGPNAYGFNIFSGPESIVDCSNEDLDHCKCLINGEDIEVDIPHVDWLDDDDHDVDLICQRAAGREKRSVPESAEKDKETTVIKTNMLSRSIKGVGSVVAGTGNLVGGGVQQVGDTAGSIISGGLHIVGKVTKNITDFLGNTVNSVGNVFESTKTTRSKRSAEEEAEDNNTSRDPEEHNEEDTDEEEAAAATTEAEEDDHDEHEHARKRRSAPSDALADEGDDKALTIVGVTESPKLIKNQGSISEVAEAGQVMRDMADLFMKAATLFQSQYTIEEAGAALLKECTTEEQKEIARNIINHVTDEDLQTEMTAVDIIKHVEPSESNRTVMQRIKHIKDHVKESDSLYTFVDRLHKDDTLDDFEKAFSERLHKGAERAVGCGLLTKESKATPLETFEELETFLKGRNDICGEDEVVSKILTIIGEMRKTPELSRSRRSVDATSKVVKKGLKKVAKKKKKAKPAKKATKHVSKSETENAEEEEIQHDEHETIDHHEEETGEEHDATECVCDPDTGKQLS